MKLDLGCGSNKHKGFYGIDYQEYPEVDLVWDLNEGIPLPDNSVDLVIAVRSLPFIKNISKLYEHIYRVCVHKAIVCILAPYAHHYRHISNPYLKHRFDEYSPRYMTNHYYQPKQGLQSPPLPNYGDHTVPYDYRLLSMEMFYDPIFYNPLYEPEELEILLQQQPNVGDEILYHYLVVKEPIEEAELDRISRLTLEVPHCVEELRCKKVEKEDDL